MQNDTSQEFARLNWSAILSYTGSVAVSLAIWVGIIRVVEHFAR
jgi:hypothetical protein